MIDERLYQYENKDTNNVACTKQYNITEKNLNKFIYFQVKKLGERHEECRTTSHRESECVYKI